jgi:hypothetical protein
MRSRGGVGIGNRRAAVSTAVGPVGANAGTASDETDTECFSYAFWRAKEEREKRVRETSRREADGRAGHNQQPLLLLISSAFAEPCIEIASYHEHLVAPTRRDARTKLGEELVFLCSRCCGRRSIRVDHHYLERLVFTVTHRQPAPVPVETPISEQARTERTQSEHAQPAPDPAATTWSQRLRSRG